MSCESCEESAYVIDKLAKLLAEIAVIVNGPEPPLTSWSYHDLPEKVRALQEAQQPAALAVPAGDVPLAAAEALALEAMRVGNLGGHERTVEGHWSAEVGDRFEEFMFEEGFALLAAAARKGE